MIEQLVEQIEGRFDELSRQMADQGAESVGQVDPEELVARAQKLWIVPPGGSLL